MLRHSFARSAAMFCWTIVAVLIGRLSAYADDSAKTPPAVYFAVAGVDPLLEHVDHVLEVGGASQYGQLLRGFLANLNNLKGIDRSRPIGFFAYAPVHPGTEPAAAFFVPVDDVEALKKTVHLGNVISLEAGDADDRLKFKTPEQTIPVRLAHGYAFLSERSEILEGDLPDPQAAVGELLKSYFVVTTFRREGVPSNLIEFGRQQLEAAALNGIPRNSSESDADYRLKQDFAALGLDVAKALINDVQRFDVGWKFSHETGQLVIEETLTCTPGSPTARTLKSLVDASPRFAALETQPAPLSAAIHISVPERLRGLLQRVVDRAEEQAQPGLNGEAAALRPHVESTLASLRKTIEAGQLDAFVQVVGGPPEHFVALGGVSLVDADRVSDALRAVLPFARDASPKPRINVDSERIAGIPFHRIEGLDQRPQDRVLYGDDASLLIGVGREAIWFALGEGTAGKDLEDVIAAPAAETRTAEPTLLSLRFALTDWLGLIGEGADDNARTFREIAQRAFPQPEDDQIEVRLAPTDEGLRLRITIEKGYLRLIGQAIAAAHGK